MRYDGTRVSNAWEMGVTMNKPAVCQVRIDVVCPLAVEC